MDVKQRLERILEAEDFEYREFSGCFDIVARRERMFLLKVLGNVDSLQETQAASLRVVSMSLGARAFVVGEKTRRELMEDNVVYERFSVPTVTANTFRTIIRTSMPHQYRFRGGLFAEMDPGRLREKRIAQGLTQAALAARAGVTKKSIYEHEKTRMRARLDVVERIEREIGPITMPVSLTDRPPPPQPAGTFERSVSRSLRRIGFETSFVSHSPFNIIAHERFVIFSEAEERLDGKKIESLRQFSEATEKPVLVVTRERTDLDVPVIREQEIRELRSVKGLEKLLRQ